MAFELRREKKLFPQNILVTAIIEYDKYGDIITIFRIQYQFK